MRGCHGNDEFSHSPYHFRFKDSFVLHFGDPMNNLAHLRNCPGVQGRLK